MKLPRPPRRASDDGHLIPLINVIFLMLIFFMLMGRITASEPLRVTPPTSGSGHERDAAGLVLLIDAEGQMALGDRRIEAGELEAAIARRGEPASRHLTIKADARLKASELRAVLDRLRETGIEGVDLMTLGLR